MMIYCYCQIRTGVERGFKVYTVKVSVMLRGQVDFETLSERDKMTVKQAETLYLNSVKWCFLDKKDNHLHPISLYYVYLFKDKELIAKTEIVNL